MNTTSETKNETMIALGRMDGRFVQATSKLKRIAAWASSKDPELHEKVLMLQNVLSAHKSGVYRNLEDYRNFPDLDRFPVILQTIEKAETACEEAERLEMPRKLLIDEVKAELKERISQIKRDAYPEDDPTCRRLEEQIRQLERT